MIKNKENLNKHNTFQKCRAKEKMNWGKVYAFRIIFLLISILSISVSFYYLSLNNLNLFLLFSVSSVICFVGFLTGKMFLRNIKW